MPLHSSPTSGALVRDLLNPDRRRPETDSRQSRRKLLSTAKLDSFQVSPELELNASDSLKPSETAPKLTWKKTAEDSLPTNPFSECNMNLRRGRVPQDGNEAFKIKLTTTRPSEQSAVEKTALKSLPDARKRSDHLREARESYRKELERRGAKSLEAGKMTMTQNLAEHMAITDNMAEVREAYKKAQAERMKGKESETKRAPKERQPPKQPKDINTTQWISESPGKQSLDVVPPRSPARSDFLVLDLSTLYVGQVQNLLCRTDFFHFSIVLTDELLRMLTHCLELVKQVSSAVFVYRTTGSWPRCSQEELRSLMCDVGIAVVYLLILGFVVMIAGRASSYIICVASWIIWLCRLVSWVYW
jgi:hypothetical protein